MTALHITSCMESNVIDALAIMIESNYMESNVHHGEEEEAEDDDHDKSMIGFIYIDLVMVHQNSKYGNFKTTTISQHLQLLCFCLRLLSYMASKELLLTVT